MTLNARSTFFGLLEKMTSADKDYRFMATNDLMTELNKDAITLDDDSERKVVKMLLRLLEDKNGEVQNLAVKCLAPLVRKVKDVQAEVMVDTLCENMVGDSEELRDVSSIALKTLISQLPPASSALTTNVIKRVTPKVTAALRQEPKLGDVGVKLEALDILADILLRYGALMSQFHAQVEEMLVPQLASPRLAVRKRAMVALAHLVPVCSSLLFDKVMQTLEAELLENKSLSTTRTYVATTAAVSRASGHRFAEWIPKVMPILLKFCTDSEDDELREACLAAFEAFILRCPKEMTPWVSKLTGLCGNFLRHDPNYHYDDDDDEDDVNGEESMEIEGEEDEEDEGDEYSDDDDVSWKVRRGAAKALEGLIWSRRDLLPQLLSQLGPLLIGRFKEREENVKGDIFHAYAALLRQAALALPAAVFAHHRVANGEAGSAEAELSAEEAEMAREMRRQVPPLVKALNRQLRDKSLKTRQAAFHLLTELIRVVPGALDDHLGLVMPGVESGLKERLANMKLDTLAFLSAALETHRAEVFRPFVARLVPLATSAVNDTFYKVAAEALTVIQGLCGVLVPLEPAVRAERAIQLYTAVFSRLKATDIDQEVKEKAIAAMGDLMAAFGGELGERADLVLPVLLERLRNEMTRLTTVRALGAVAAAEPPAPDLTPILSDALPLLADFLRKNQRGLKIATLQLLEALVCCNYGATLVSQGLLNVVLVELPVLIHESDLQITQLALNLLTEMVTRLGSGAVGSEALEAVMGQIVVLVQSPLLQGASLKALLAFLASLATSLPSGMGVEELLARLTGPVHDPAASAVGTSTAGTSSTGFALHKQAYLSIAKCVATLAAAQPDRAPAITAQLAQRLKSRSRAGEEGGQLFSLLALGEIGRRCPEVFGRGSGVHPEQLISAAFQSPSEEIKTAASYSLGGLAVGNLEQFLPFILREIESESGRQYLLLHALKEVIGSEALLAESPEAAAVFRPRVGDIWDVLVAHAKCSEEGTRNVVAECLGRLTRMEPDTLLAKLRGYINDPTWAVRATVVTAVKFTIVDSPQPSLDPLLKASIPAFLATLTDEDLNVRRVALVTFNSAAHNKASLVRELLPTLLPSLYAETKVRRELVREVEMGPFKHTVDDGLDLRKAAFECMYTLLERCLERIDILEFLSHLEDGLKDHYDIKLLTYLMLARMGSLCPAQVVQRMARLVEPIKATILAKAKANSVKQEVEKQEELKRSALRAVAALQSVRESEKVPQLAELLTTIRTSPELSNLFAAVQKDPALGSGRRPGPGDSAMEVDVL